MIVARTAADVARTVEAEAPALAGIIGLEGADPLPNADALADFFALGLRLVIPAWDDNHFSGSSTGGGGPLTAEGIKLIELARELRVMVDVSHLSDAAFDQVRDLMAGRPFIASHSNCRSLSPASRNLTDAQIRVLADSGGVMGINLAPDFLDPDYLAAWDAIMAPVRHADSAPDPATRYQHRMAAGPQLHAIPRPSLDMVARHVQHAIAGRRRGLHRARRRPGRHQLHAGAGDRRRELSPDRRCARVRAGLTERQVEKVCWRNMARVFQEVLP